MVAGAAVALALIGAAPAQAHPLGNFTVNHYDGLVLSADGVVDSAVLDLAEIPTRQTRRIVDADSDGKVTATERAAWAATACVDKAAATSLSVDGTRVDFAVTASAMEYRTGAAGLDTTRLTCTLAGDVRLDRRSTVVFADEYNADRIGWHEVTATTGDGVRLSDSPVPATSITDQLRTYPNDLLSSPLDVRSATLDVLPGAGQSTFVKSLDGVPGAGPFTRALQQVSRAVDDTVGADNITVTAGLLAVLLSVMLGAGHALLPGHGKTVMAAYIAGRRGSVKDAVTVGATVTVTHTAGVLLLGLLLTVSASVAGEAVTGWLGVASGLLVAAIGIGLLVNAVRGRGIDSGHVHGPGGHSHDADGGEQPWEDGHDHPHDDHHGHDHPHDHPHDDDHGHDRGHESPVPVGAVAAGESSPAAVTATVLSTGHTAVESPHTDQAHSEHPHGDTDHAQDDSTHHQGGRTHSREPRLGRGGLVGMGIAGGLVPSPSAVVVLLGAVALGRTVFGVLLVLAYGLGMAGTLTLAGLALVRVRGRIDTGRFRSARRLSVLAPYVTASLVLVVGLALAARGLTAV